jgi:glycosyltransferase involved in cell wall biosynthesis
MRLFLFSYFNGDILRYSIIIPTLNEEKLLPKLLEQLNNSPLKKKYDFEIVISDGGSHDGTIEIAQLYADIVKVHNEEKRQNIAMGRNDGFRVSSGEILIFLNGDVLLNDVESFFWYIEKHFVHSDYAAMTCKVKVFKEEEKLSDIIFHTLYNSYFYLLNLIGVGMGRGECQIIKRRFFVLVGGNNMKLDAGEDFDLFKRIRRYGKILFANDICIYESPRRYRKLGYNGVTWSWIKNSLSIMFKNKSLSKEWEQVR